MYPERTRLRQAVTLKQAADESPTLAGLAALARESGQRLAAVKALIPPALHGAIQAGPIEDTSWCLLIQGNAAAAKLRQLLPALAARLRTQGWNVQSIRLKVLVGTRR